MNKAIHDEWAGSQVLLLDYDGAAKALAMSRPALRDLVYKGRGPRTTKIGRRTFFAVKDLEAFIDQHREPPPVRREELPLVSKPRRGRPAIAELKPAKAKPPSPEINGYRSPPA
jgi:predicted DNA-binding transcriptional regulator AlpA